MPIWIFGAAVIVAAFAVLVFLSSRKRKKLRQEEKEKKEARAKGDAQGLIRLLDQYREKINQAEDLHIIVENFEKIFENVEKLVNITDQYRHLELTSPPAREIQDFYVKERERYIGDLLLEQAENELERVKSLSGKAEKLDVLEKALAVMLDGKQYLRDPGKRAELDVREFELRESIDRIRRGG